MTAQVKRFPKKLAQSERTRDPETHALWEKYDGLGNELRDMAQELGAICAAAAGLAEAVNDDQPLYGIQKILWRIERRVSEIADEVRL